MRKRLTLNFQSPDNSRIRGVPENGSALNDLRACLTLRFMSGGKVTNNFRDLRRNIWPINGHYLFRRFATTSDSPKTASKDCPCRLLA
jgi:hypothetical protein